MSYKSRIYQQWDGSKEGAVYTLPFPFISEKHIKVSLNGNSFEHFTFQSENSIRLTASDGVGGELCIYRETPTTPLVKWADGTILQAANLNIVLTQTQYILEESQDKTIAEIVKTDKSVALTALEQIKAEYEKSIKEIQGLKERVSSELHTWEQEITDKINPATDQMRRLNAVVQSYIPQLVEYNKTFSSMTKAIAELFPKIEKAKTDTEASLKTLNDWHDQTFAALEQLAAAEQQTIQAYGTQAKGAVDAAKTSALTDIGTTLTEALKKISEAGGGGGGGGEVEIESITYVTLNTINLTFPKGTSLATGVTAQVEGYSPIKKKYDLIIPITPFDLVCVPPSAKALQVKKNDQVTNIATNTNDMISYTITPRINMAWKTDGWVDIFFDFKVFTYANGVMIDVIKSVTKEDTQLQFACGVSASVAPQLLCIKFKKKKTTTGE